MKKKWSFLFYEFDSNAKHSIYTGAFSNADYLCTEEPKVSEDQIRQLGRKLQFGEPTAGVLTSFDLAFHHYIYGHSRFIKAPLKSEIRDDMKKINSGAKAILKALDSISTDDYYRNTFNYLLDQPGLNFFTQREIKNVIDNLEKSTNEYLKNYVAHDSRPTEDYIYAFIFMLSVAFKEWTGRDPSAPWDEYKDKYYGEFVELVQSCFELLKEPHRKSNNSIGQVIKNIEFSEVKAFLNR